jgi:small subunit ribosomal protein S27e
MTKSKFLKVKCKNCGNMQVIFGSAASKIACTACGATIATPRGGKTNVQTKIVAVLD